MRPLDELLARHPLPDITGGKETKGTLVIVGGPPSCPGAVMLAALGSLRAGSGRVQVVVDPKVAPAVATAVPELLVVGWDQCSAVPSEVARLVEGADAVVIGPGHHRLEPHTVLSVAQAAGKATVILDAGALAGVDHLDAATNVIVAPNTAEAQRLLEVDVERDEQQLAVALADKLQRPVAVRGAATVVTDGAACWFAEAPPGLGTPGSGDVFIGVLGGLMAGGMEPVGALGWAVALHGRAGAMLAADTPVGYLASDIAAQLPYGRVMQP